MTERLSSPADVTPVDRSSEPPIRDEMRQLRGSIDSLRSDIGAAIDSIGSTLLRQLRADAAKHADDLQAFLTAAIATERTRTASAITEAEARVMLYADKIGERLDDRITELSLKVGVSLSENDLRDSKIEGDAARAEKLAKDARAEVRTFTRGRVGFGLGSAAIALAAKSEITWAGVKLWAWSHGLLLTVVCAIVAFVIVVEIVTRLRARKGTAA